ncbi:1,4-alpha-glucan branching protein GlgB, partial [bacterium]
MVDFIKRLRNGCSTMLPAYDYGEGKITHREKIYGSDYDIVILEGLVSWNTEELRSLFDTKIFMKVDKALQLERMLERDIRKYGYSPEEVRKYHEVLAREYQQFLCDKVQYADILIEDNRIFWVNDGLQFKFEELINGRISQLVDEEGKEVIEVIHQASDERWDTLIFGMDKSKNDKARIVYDINGLDVMEIGCGGGAIISGIVQHINGARVVGVDYNGYLLTQARKRFPRDKFPQVEFYLRDVCHWYDKERFEKRFDAVILGSTFHEIASFYGFEKAQEVIELCHYFLKPGGRLIMRDGLRPEEKRVIFSLRTDFSREQFVKFVRDFEQRKINAFYDTDKNIVEMSAPDFYELLVKYIYTKDYSWKDEMKEAFGVVSEKEYRRLISVYFNIRKIETYRLEYLLKDRWEKDFEILSGEFPYSHIYLMAEKSASSPIQPTSRVKKENLRIRERLKDIESSENVFVFVKELQKILRNKNATVLNKTFAVYLMAKAYKDSEPQRAKTYYIDTLVFLNEMRQNHSLELTDEIRRLEYETYFGLSVINSILGNTQTAQYYALEANKLKESFNESSSSPVSFPRTSNYDHKDVYADLKALGLGRLPLLWVDYHSDSTLPWQALRDTENRELNCGNVINYIKRDKLAGHILWHYPLHGRHLLVSLDMDFFATNGVLKQAYYNPNEGELFRNVYRIFKLLSEYGIAVRFLNETYSCPPGSRPYSLAGAKEMFVDSINKSISLVSASPISSLVTSEEQSRILRLFSPESLHTKLHSEHVRDLVLILGRLLNMSAADLEILQRVALKHDVGKTESRIMYFVNSPRVLTTQELDFVRFNHPSRSLEILAQNNIETCNIEKILILYHHVLNGIFQNEIFKNMRFDEQERNLFLLEIFTVCDWLSAATERFSPYHWLRRIEPDRDFIFYALDEQVANSEYKFIHNPRGLMRNLLGQEITWDILEENMECKGSVIACAFKYWLGLPKEKSEENIFELSRQITGVNSINVLKRFLDSLFYSEARHILGESNFDKVFKLVVSASLKSRFKDEASAYFADITVGSSSSSVSFIEQAKITDARIIKELEKFVFTDFDCHLFTGEGRHYRVYDKLGSHPIKIDGETVGTYFAAWAPNARYVSVTGDFNEWHYFANRMYLSESAGIWQCFIPEAKEGNFYKYCVLGSDSRGRIKSDPYAFYNQYPTGEELSRTASIIWDLSYQWNDEEWIRERKGRQSLDKPLSIYEVHLGSWRRKFEDGQWHWLTYREIAQELTEYVSEMGFTHVEFLPVSEHWDYRSWGYRVSNYYAPTSRYGTPQDFMYLIDSLHQKGIGVFLDIVPGHFTSDMESLVRFDGSELYSHDDPRRGRHFKWDTYAFNLGRAEIRSFLISNAFFWLDEYHVDGLRIDAVNSMLYWDYDRGAGQWLPNERGGVENYQGISFLQELNAAAHDAYSGILTIAEDSSMYPGVCRFVEQGGLGFDMKWSMGWMHDTLEYLSRAYSRYRQYELAHYIDYAFSENFILPLSHDEIVHGKHSLLGKMPYREPWRIFGNLKLLFGLMFTMPGKKLLFMGDEFANKDEWNPDGSPDWFLLGDPQFKGIQAWVKDLNNLYRSEPALYQHDFEPNGFEWIIKDSYNGAFSFIRRGANPNECLVTIFNLDTETLKGRLRVPWEGDWQVLINSDSGEYFGSGIGISEKVLIAKIEPEDKSGRPGVDLSSLPPLSMLVLKGVRKEVSAASPIEDKSSELPLHWDSSWKIPGLKELKSADEFLEDFKDSLVNEVEDGVYVGKEAEDFFIKYTITKYKARGDDSGSAYQAAQVLKAIYFRNPEVAAVIVATMREKAWHIFWGYLFWNLEVLLSQELINRAAKQIRSRQIVFVEEVPYEPDYSSYTLGGAILHISQDVLKGIFKGLDTLAQQVMLEATISFYVAKENSGIWFGRLKREAFLEIIIPILKEKPELYASLSDKVKGWLNIKDEAIASVNINEITIDDVKDDPGLNKIQQWASFNIGRLDDYLVLLEELIRNAGNEILPIEEHDILTKRAGYLLHESLRLRKRDNEFPVQFIVEEFLWIKNLLEKFRKDKDVLKRKMFLENRNLFIFNIFSREFDKLLAQYIRNNGIKSHHPNILGKTVGRLKVIRATDEERRKFEEIGEDDIVVVEDFPPQVRILSGIAGIITTRLSGFLSHASVKAKALYIPCACFPISLDVLSKLDGEWMLLDVSSKDVTLRKASEDEIKNRKIYRKPPQKIEILKIDISPDMPNIIKGYLEGIEKLIGHKAANQLFLQAKRVCKTPVSIALTFGMFRKVMGAEVNRILKADVERLLKSMDKSDIQDISSKLNRVQKAIESLEIPREILDEVMAGINKNIGKESLLILRTSTNAEDLPDYPGVGAGVYDSYEGVEREEYSVAEAILKAYTSLFSYEAFRESELYDIERRDILPAILMQELISADYSFGVHTVHPLTGNARHILIEVVQGLGAGLRSNSCPGLPHQFVYDRDTKNIISAVKADKQLKLVPEKGSWRSGHRFEAVDYSRDIFVEETEHKPVKQIAEIAINIEGIFGRPQDIEGAIEIKNGQPDIYIVQNRTQKIDSAASPVSVEISNIGLEDERLINKFLKSKLDTKENIRRAWDEVCAWW